MTKQRIYSSLTELIGHTPLLEVRRIAKAENLKAKVIVKIESFNPGGSVKDRAALSMIETAEQEGRLKPGSLIIENDQTIVIWVNTCFHIYYTIPELAKFFN